jgi:transposase
MLKVMIYAHCTAKRSLRDMCSAIHSMPNRLYHLGIEGVSRNNLSNALLKRNAALFEKLFYQLLEKVRIETGSRRDTRFKFKNILIAIDSTTISLCLALCSWASFRTTKGGIKVHTMFDIKRQLPDFMIITEARKHDNTVIKEMPFLDSALYVLDKAYLCLKTLQKINENKAFFVTRIKSNTQYCRILRNKRTSKSILRDWVISFTGVKTHEYKGSLRLVRYRNPEDGNVYDYITNNMDLTATTIAAIYKSRWDIELFFKWLKQNVKVKSFYGRSENAVRIQIWTAAIALLLTKYIQFLSKTAKSITEVFRILGANIMSDSKIHDLLCEPPRRKRSTIRCLDVQLDFGF